MSTARGVMFVHSAPSAVCRHIEWTLAGAIGAPVTLDWTPQPAERSSYRAELVWQGRPGTAAKLATSLAEWRVVRFEITEDPAPGADGQRYSFTPRLGLFRAMTGASGDIAIPEDRMRATIAQAAITGRDLATEIDELLGGPWDAELEVFRHAGEGAPVRWLSRAV